MHYGLLSRLAQADDGIIILQVVKKTVKDAAVRERHIFGGIIKKKVKAAVNLGFRQSYAQTA